MSNARRGGKQISNPTMTTSKNIHKITTLKNIMKNKKTTKKHPFMNTLTKYQLITDHMRYFIEGNKPKHS